MEKKKIVTVQMDENFYNEVMSGNSGGGGSASSVEYLDIKGDAYLLDILAGGIVSMKVKIEGDAIPIECMISSGAIMLSMLQELVQMGARATPSAIEFNPDLLNMTKQNGEITRQTAYEMLVSKGESYIQTYNNIPRITKEEFYTL